MSAAAVISSVVFMDDTESRMLERARSSLCPMACMMRDGSRFPVLQADPLEMQRPFSEVRIKRSPAGTLSMLRWEVLGNLCSLVPLR